MTALIRYWFEFNLEDDNTLPGVRTGCGVTAFSYSDALQIMSIKIFNNKKLPEITKFIENVDISALDQGHLVPNMWTPNFRGVWFPRGYHDN